LSWYILFFGKGGLFSKPWNQNATEGAATNETQEEVQGGFLEGDQEVTDGQVSIPAEEQEEGQNAKSEIEIFQEIDQMIKKFSVEIACSIMLSAQRLVSFMNSQ